MSSSPMSLYEIRMEGWKALTERLGPAGAMRFMMQYDPGHGDYSKERHELFKSLLWRSSSIRSNNRALLTSQQPEAAATRTEVLRSDSGWRRDRRDTSERSFRFRRKLRNR